MEEQKEIENLMAQHPTYIFNYYFPMMKNHHLRMMRKKHKNTKEACTDGPKSTGKIVGFAAVFLDINRRGTLSEKTLSKQLK